MTRRIGAAVLALTLVFGGSAAINPAAAVRLPAAVQKPPTWKATDLSARRRPRHLYRYAYRDRYAYRAYDRPSYYDRPYFYRPYPYSAPAPFFLGFAFAPWW